MSGTRSYPRQTPVENYSYTHLTTAQGTPTQINTVSRAAVLGRVTINTLGTSPVLTLTDGSGGATIAVITPTAPGSIDYGVVAKSGLFYTLSGTGSISISIAWLDQAPVI